MEHVPPVFIGISLDPPGRIRRTILLARREVMSKFSSLWFWMVASLLGLMAYSYGGGFQQTFQTESVVVTADPLLGLNTTIVGFLGLVLGLRLACGISWEREHGTLEVLRAGPVSWLDLLVAKFLAEVAVLGALGAIYVAYLLIAQPLGDAMIGPEILLPVLGNMAFVLPVMATGLVVSVLAGTVRMAVVMYLSVLCGLCLYEAVFGLLRAMTVDEMSLFALYLRAALEAAAPFVRPLSPVSGIALLVDNAMHQDVPAIGQSMSSLGLTLLLFAAAWLIARIKGARA
ncbi:MULTISPECIES: ABC transporter permease subunit [unclassified Rhizobium]|nr:ABC-2 family transporter [Rhizobium sp. 57MFTsu3.2]